MALIAAPIWAIGLVLLGPVEAHAAASPPASTLAALSPIQALSLLGYSPDALAIAGVSDDELEQARAFFAARSEEMRAVRGLREALAKKATDRSSTEGEGAATSAVEAELEARLASLRTSFLLLFAESSQGMLRRWIATEGYEVDSEYRVLDLESAQWKRLEQAIGAQRMAARTGERVPISEQELIDEFRARPDVAAAVARLTGRSGAVRQALRS